MEMIVNKREIEFGVSVSLLEIFFNRNFLLFGRYEDNFCLIDLIILYDNFEEGIEFCGKMIVGNNRV